MTKITVDTVVSAVGQGGIPTRQQIADRLGRDKTTHLITTIERAVQSGRIVKMAGHTSGRSCWRYALRESAIGLFKINVEIEDDLVMPSLRSELFEIAREIETRDWNIHDASQADELGSLVLAERSYREALNLLIHGLPF